jgi:hypothetical protein
VTTAQTTPHRDRPLGRPLSTLIPQNAPASSTAQAAAALAALQTVPVHIGVLEAAALQLEDRAQSHEDEAARETAAATATLLRTAMEQRS